MDAEYPASPDSGHGGELTFDQIEGIISEATVKYNEIRRKVHANESRISAVENQMTELGERLAREEQGSSRIKGLLGQMARLVLEM